MKDTITVEQASRIAVGDLTLFITEAILENEPCQGHDSCGNCPFSGKGCYTAYLLAIIERTIRKHM